MAVVTGRPFVDISVQRLSNINQQEQHNVSPAEVAEQPPEYRAYL